MKIISIIFLLGAASAHAGLGDQESGVASDRRAFRAKAAVVRAETANYTINTISNDAYTVKEYVSGSGKVFAVSWRGIVKPDLSVLLGSYYTEFETVRTSTPLTPHRQPVRFRTANIEVQAGGHVRDIRGRAFIRSEVPAGVAIGDLQ